MVIRPETPGDVAAIRAVETAAFGQPDEAALVDAIRESGAPAISLVADVDGAIAGHILFSEADIAGTTVAALAPMAVTPERQRIGIGSRIVRAGLDACREAGYPAVIVLGHAEYYPRFGFTPARTAGIECPYDAPDASWMVRELCPGALDNLNGLVVYHDALAAL